MSIFNNGAFKSGFLECFLCPSDEVLEELVLEEDGDDEDDGEGGVLGRSPPFPFFLKISPVVFFSFLIFFSNLL